MHGDFVVIGYPHTEIFCFNIAGKHIAHRKRCVFLRLFVVEFNGRRLFGFGGRALGGLHGGAARRLAAAVVGLGRVLVRGDPVIRHGHGGGGGVRYFVVYKRTAEG